MQNYQNDNHSQKIHLRIRAFLVKKISHSNFAPSYFMIFSNQGQQVVSYKFLDLSNLWSVL